MSKNSSIRICRISFPNTNFLMLSEEYMDASAPSETALEKFQKGGILWHTSTGINY
jgi:hypothetical protein